MTSVRARDVPVAVKKSSFRRPSGLTFHTFLAKTPLECLWEPQTVIGFELFVPVLCLFGVVPVRVSSFLFGCPSWPLFPQVSYFPAKMGLFPSPMCSSAGSCVPASFVVGAGPGAVHRGKPAISRTHFTNFTVFREVYSRFGCHF